MSTPTFSKLLLATEGTEFDAGAMRVALAMASAQAVPLGVVFPLMSNPEYEAVAPQAAAKAERDVAVSLAKLHDLASKAGVTLEVCVRRGSAPDQEILDEAVRSNADLLILRRRGKSSFLSRLLIGEMVGRILDRAPCDVLIVPRTCKLWQRGIMVVIEGSETASAGAIAATGAAMARTARLPLSLLVISSGGEDAARPSLALAEAAAASAGVVPHSELVHIESAPGNTRAAITAGADLLVIRFGAPGTSSGTLMRKVIAACDVPVLALRR